MKRKILSTILVIIMCIGFWPNVEVSATDQNMSNPRITDYTDNQFFIEKLGVLFDKLVNSQYNYFTTTGKTCGNSSCSLCNASNVTKQHPTISSLNVAYSGNTWSCYGFAKWTFKYLYGKDATGVYDNPGSRGKTNTTTVVASTYNGNSAKEVIQQAKIGDILQSPRPHSMIFLKCDSNYFYVLHSNWKWSNEGNNIVKVSKFSYDKFNNITVYRANNYSDYIGNSSETYNPTPTPTPTPTPIPTPAPEKSELELSTTLLGIDHINNPEASVGVHISGTFPEGGSLDVKSGSAVTTEWTDYNYRDATLIIRANWQLAENDEVVTVILLDSNKNTLAKKSINVYSTSQKHLVQFDANGGNNSPEDMVKWKGLEVTIPYAVPTRAGYEFLGWAKSQYANRADYKRGDSYSDDIDIVLYAVWEEINYDFSLSFDYYVKNTKDLQILQYRVYGNEDLISDVKFECDSNIECDYYIGYDENADCHMRFTFEKTGKINDTFVKVKLFDEHGKIITQEELSVFNFSDRNTDGITVYINDEKVNFDVQPIIINSRTMVPMRKIFEELGAVVGWSDNSQTAYGYTDDTLIKIGIGNDYLYKNDEIVSLDSPAIVMSGRTLVPARAIAESLNCKVEWIDEYQIVEITKENIDFLPKRSELKIGWCEYAPINYRNDNGTLTGFDTELAEYVCRFWGWKAAFVEIPFEEAFPAIIDGRVDCYWNAITATEERAENCTFTNIYLETDVDYEDVDGTWGVSHEMYSVPFQKDDYLTVHLTNIALEAAKAEGVIDTLKYKYGM